MKQREKIVAIRLHAAGLRPGTDSILRNNKHVRLDYMAPLYFLDRNGVHEISRTADDSKFLGKVGYDIFLRSPDTRLSYTLLLERFSDQGYDQWQDFPLKSH